MRLAIFASGGGSNAAAIIRYFSSHSIIAIELVVSNKANAGVLEIAKAAGLPVVVIENRQWNDAQQVLTVLQAHCVQAIVLAGFLRLVPPYLVAAYPNKIINIHPSLLPKFGGKGMYGNHVHEAVLAAHEKFSGCSIHLVNEEFDKGELLFQAQCKVYNNDTAATLAARVLPLEHYWYPRIIERTFAR